MPRSWLSLLTWLGFAALVAVAVATSGLGGSSSPRREAPAPARPPAVAPRLSDAAATRWVRRLQLRAGDLPTGFAPVVTRNRAERDAEDGLRLCGRLVPADRLRLAGDRAAFVDPHGRRVRTEIAVYAPGGAAEAVRRLQAAPASCARPVAPGHVELPSTLALDVLTGDATDRTRHELVVLRRGDVLVLLAVDGPPGPLTLGVTRTLGGRLLT